MSDGVMYRYEYYPATYEDSFIRHGKLEIIEYPIIKHTTCGVWISDWGKKRFINTTLKKQFAYKTKDAALYGFKKRKERHLAILRLHIDDVENALELIKRIEECKLMK